MDGRRWSRGSRMTTSQAEPRFLEPAPVYVRSRSCVTGGYYRSLHIFEDHRKVKDAFSYGCHSLRW